ncbi:hypothetical protein DES51_107224 [Dielma fastidiosa]|uniref:Cell wall binding repeat protein n=2 Tax=Dielma fastidiosa TaxID=1034346 RepID=A0A318KQ41_9FIRM|nr:hypothetical protein [Dielma fastidiosa]PXX78682.1 hypothetical protein DES51_107224 [Dielma fastidiosa]
MNKYSSKAVKTAATVGMSLAMVLSNAAPVLAYTTQMPTETTTTAENFIGKFNDALADAGLSLENLQIGDKIKFGGATPDEEVEIVKFTTGTGIEVESTLKADFTKVANLVTYKGDSYNTADYVLGLANALTRMAYVENTESKDESLVADINALMNGANYDKEEEMLTITGYNAALTLKKDIDKYEKYEGNLPENPIDGTDDKVYSAEEYSTAKEQLLEAISNFQADNFGETLDKYLTDLEKLYDNFVDYQGEIGITKSSVDTVVKGIKNGTYATTAYNKVKYSNLTKENYEVFKEEDSVVELLEQFTTGYDNIADVKEALDAKNEYTTALTKDKAKYPGSTTKISLSAWLTNEDIDFDFVLENMTDEMFAIIKDYKENVIDVILALDSKKVGSTYVEKSEKSAYVTDSDLAKMLKYVAPSDKSVEIASNKFGLFTISDKKEGTRYYDDLVSHMEEVATALKAVTTDIAKLTPANIKTTDKALLEAAEDAIFELTSVSKGDYVHNLTAGQEKEVRAAEAKITNLREAFDNLGTTNVAGWYDMGNGNWGYNNEDGTPAAYKWVASGADWYMIKDGKMLRNTWLATDGGRWYYLDNAGKMVTNQSVDGCWINSYGVYMSPSYNG